MDDLSLRKVKIIMMTSKSGLLRKYFRANPPDKLVSAVHERVVMKRARL